MSPEEEKAKRDQHELKAAEFVAQMEVLIIQAFHLGDAAATAVFATRHKLVSSLRELLRDEYNNGHYACAERARRKVTEALRIL